MEKKKKKKKKKTDYTSHEATKSNELLRKEDQNHSNVGLSALKNAAISTSSDDNAPPSNQQFQPVVQWPQSTQSMEQLPLNSKPCVSIQSPSPTTLLSQWPLSQHQQPNQPPPHLTQPAMPFWLAQQPGYQLSGANAPFAPVGRTDISWQGPATGGGISNQAQIPSFCYHVNYPYPGFPGPWDPTSWWGQAQQSLHHCAYSFPGACGYLSSRSPLMPGCSADSTQFFQRGTIQPPPKLSQKHQLLWEAQSAENVQLWAVVGQLQSELADYKSRLIKLESEVFSEKPTIHEPTTLASGTCLAGQSSKKGRPKKQISSVDALPRPCGRKPAQCNVQADEAKQRGFRKKSLKKIEQKENPVQQPNGGNNANVLTKWCSGIEISGPNPLFPNQIHNDIPSVGLCSSELKAIDNENGDSKTVFSMFSHQVKGVEPKGASENNENFVSTSNIPSGQYGRDLINISTQGYFNADANVTGEGMRNVVVGWSFGNEEAAPRSLQNAAVDSANDEDEEMEEDDDSLGAEDIA
ncbi:uncharacterized protein LOC114298609 [Camellia sinensis]|uniref:uncharacterized protein LOC114298609 n=1 Tax=Camellia sinensis TaxID=4442 RepID=UPI00103651AC|nr:uncharacterized protein LOC114298609 [Camellia sinensis]